MRVRSETILCYILNRIFPVMCSTGETFRVPREKEIRQVGECRTTRLVLEAWGRLENEGIYVNKQRKNTK